MKKFFKNLGVWLFMITMVFAMVYMIVISADAEYEVSQEKERIYFEKLEEMRND